MNNHVPPNPGGIAKLPPTVLEMIAEEESRDGRLFRWSMVIAVTAHLLFFAMNWSFLAFGGERTGVDQEKPHIYVIKQVKFTPPPKQDLPPITRPRTQRIPIPDANPNDPEPIRTDDAEDVFPEVESDQIWAVPDAPPPIEPEGTLRFVKGGKITEPKRIAGANPAYPSAAHHAGIQGTVILECVIGKDGQVKSISTLRGMPLGLTESAIAAVETWQFEPSTLNGHQVEVLYVLTVKFTLQ